MTTLYTKEHADIIWHAKLHRGIDQNACDQFIDTMYTHKNVKDFVRIPYESTSHKYPSRSNLKWRSKYYQQKHLYQQINNSALSED